MHVLPTTLAGNPNIGLFGFCTDRYCLISSQVSPQDKKEFSTILNVPLIELTIAGTDLLGVFLAGNKKSLLIPNITFPHERNILKTHNIPFTVIESHLTCLGNTIVANDKGAIISPEFPEETQRAIAAALNVPVKQTTIASLPTPGSLIATNKKYGLISPDATAEERDIITKTLGITLTEGTVNMGNPYIRSGILCNSKGFLIGNNSGGPEIVNADEALGFTNQENHPETNNEHPA
ncbi:translation initiation factor IF-6 [Candidatus Woesearchaeota archaeon]|nr:MAG: translation initiation factor IF-6 [Candidatus Woesearchaeota archaeon]